MSSCYICERVNEDDDNLYRVCSCNTLIHKQCFVQLVQNPRYRERCAICLQPYRQTSLRYVRTCRCQCKRILPGWVSVLFILLGTCISVCLAIYSAFYYDSYRNEAAWGIVLFYVVIGVGVIVEILAAVIFIYYCVKHVCVHEVYVDVEMTTPPTLTSSCIA